MIPRSIFPKKSLTTIKPLLVCSTLLMTQAAAAHHSVSYHFNPDAPNHIEGVVKSFTFRNPHTEMLVDVADSDGTTTTWRVEMTSRATLQKQGWTREQFKPGQTIKIDGFLARRDENSMYLRTADVGDGDTTSFKYGKLAPSPTSESAAGDINNSIVGTWVRAVQPEDPTRGGQPLGPNEENPYLANLTQQGKEAASHYVAERDDPSLKCQASSIIRVWGQPDFSPTKITREGDVLTIHHEVFDFKRTIHLNKQHPANIEPSLKGYSVAHFEGDDLIIETTGFTAGILNTHPGIYHTNQLRIIERLSIDKTTGGMSLEWSATDPVYFAKPQTDRSYFVRSNIEVGEFNCELD
jgi:hypothetical protein